MAKRPGWQQPPRIQHDDRSGRRGRPGWRTDAWVQDCGAYWSASSREYRTRTCTKALRFPMQNGGPCEDSVRTWREQVWRSALLVLDLQGSLRVGGEVLIFRILVSDRVDLSVSCSRVKVLF
jgi:hypothetical protein